MGLSIRGYAAHRGVSHTTVRKAICLWTVTLEPDGSIDPAKADRSWVQNADPSKTRARPEAQACAGSGRQCRAGDAVGSQARPSSAA